MSKHVKVLRQMAKDEERYGVSAADTRQLRAAANQLEQVENALQELVKIKDYKDAHGKDDWYRAEQPRAWEEARKALK